MSATAIAEKAGRVKNRFKMAKHFALTIADGVFHYQRDTVTMEREATLDGFHIGRTSESAERVSADDVVRSYKNLARVESAFRSLKSVDLRIRPIRHRTPNRVRAHLFLCMLAYYVEWHLRQALAPLLFAGEELEQDRAERDPVLPAQPSPSAQQKKARRQTRDGLALHSMETLLAKLATRCKCQCRLRSDPGHTPVQRLTESFPLHDRALKLVRLFPVRGISNT